MMDRGTVGPWSARRVSILSLAYLALSVFVYWLQHLTLSSAVYLGLQGLYLYLLVPLILKRRHDLALCHATMFFVVFHQYAADPYNETFVNAIDGPAKYVALGVALSLLWRPPWRLTALLSLGVLCTYAVFATLVNVVGVSRYLLNDVLTYGLLFSVYSYRTCAEPLGRAFRQVVFRYVTLLPAAYVIVFALGLTHEVAGSRYFFYGHLFGFLIVWSLFVSLFDGSTRTWEKASVLVSVALWVPVAQTEHLAIVLVLMAYLASLRFSFRSVIALFAGAVALVVVARVSVPGTWTALKIGQLVGLLTFDLSSANSLAIRVAELFNILAGNSTYQSLLGNGLGAVYRDWGFFSSLLLHDQTFPLDQLNSGRFHLIHVGPVKLFFNLGVLGLLGVTAAMAAKVWRSARITPSLVVPVFFFFFVWHASIEAAMFLAIFATMVDGESRRNQVDVDAPDSDALDPSASPSTLQQA